MMRGWIDRYGSEVARRLPRSQRDDVRQELESTLLDELEGRRGAEPQEGEILDVLREMGPPAAVAAGYRPSSQYLIGPAWYPTFCQTLKVVLSVLVGVLVLASAVSALLSPAALPPGIALLGLLQGAVASALYALGILILIFTLLERFEVRREAPQHAWDPRTLPSAPRPGDLYGRGEALVALSLVAIFLALLHIFRNEVGFPGATAGRPLLNDVYQQFLPWLSAALLLDMALYGWLFWRGRWELGTRLAHFAFDLFGFDENIPIEEMEP